MGCSVQVPLTLRGVSGCQWQVGREIQVTTPEICAGREWLPRGSDQKARLSAEEGKRQSPCLLASPFVVWSAPKWTRWTLCVRKPVLKETGFGHRRIKTWLTGIGFLNPRLIQSGACLFSCLLREQASDPTNCGSEQSDA